MKTDSTKAGLNFVTRSRQKNVKTISFGALYGHVAMVQPTTSPPIYTHANRLSAIILKINMLFTKYVSRNAKGNKLVQKLLISKSGVLFIKINIAYFKLKTPFLIA